MCPSQLCRYRDGAACWISSSCYPDHTISRNSGTLGRPLVVRQMFLNPPTGSSRPLTSNTKKKGSEASTLATRWSANLVRSAHLVQRSRFFNQIGRQINRDAALLLLTLRRIVSQKVQLLKIYTLNCRHSCSPCSVSRYMDQGRNEWKTPSWKPLINAGRSIRGDFGRGNDALLEGSHCQ